MNRREAKDAANRSSHLLELGIIKILPPKYFPKATRIDLKLRSTDVLSIFLEVWNRLFKDIHPANDTKRMDAIQTNLLLK